MTMLTERYVEPRCGTWDPSERPAGRPGRPRAERRRAVARGHAACGSPGIYTLVAIAIISALTFLPDAPLRNPETGEIFGNSPFMSSLLFIISMLFLAAGLGYGKGAGSLTGGTNVINAIVKTFNGLGGLIFLMLLIAQFIAYFNYSNISNIAATSLADLLGRADIGALPLLIGFILLVFVIDMIMPGVIPKWAIIAPIFIPLFYNLGIAPQTVRGGLPGRRRTGQRDHPADGLPAVHHPGLPALPGHGRHGHGHLDDDPVHRRRAGDLDALLRRLVPHRHPVGPGLAGPSRLAAMRDG